MNRVQTTDGVWRTLDSRGLFRSVVGLSEMYNGVLSDYLTQSLGWGWEACGRRHSNVPKYKVAGVSERLREEFASRTTDIEAAKDVLVAAFVASHGRQPAAREVLKLRQGATLSTDVAPETSVPTMVMEPVAAERTLRGSIVSSAKGTLCGTSHLARLVRRSACGPGLTAVCS